MIEINNTFIINNLMKPASYLKKVGPYSLIREIGSGTN